MSDQAKGHSERVRAAAVTSTPMAVRRPSWLKKSYVKAKAHALRAAAKSVRASLLFDAVTAAASIADMASPLRRRRLGLVDGGVGQAQFFCTVARWRPPASSVPPHLHLPSLR